MLRLAELSLTECLVDTSLEHKMLCMVVSHTAACTIHNVMVENRVVGINTHYGVGINPHYKGVRCPHTSWPLRV